MTFDGIKAKIGSGLLAFPITDFGADDEFDAASYARRLRGDRETLCRVDRGARLIAAPAPVRDRMGPSHWPGTGR